MVFNRYSRQNELWVTPKELRKIRDRMNVLAYRWQRKNRVAHLASVKASKTRSKERDPAVFLAKARMYNKKRYDRLKAEGRLDLIFNSAKKWLNGHPSRREASYMRSRISAALKMCASGQAVKAARTAELVGCSWEFLVKHIEAQFLPGMTWENRAAWHIDHIRPCASFYLTDPAQQRLCFHYTNLRPLWAADNIRKGARYEQPN